MPTFPSHFANVTVKLQRNRKYCTISPCRIYCKCKVVLCNFTKAPRGGGGVCKGTLQILLFGCEKARKNGTNNGGATAGGGEGTRATLQFVL